jgi:ElaB/YqjD/DUF883 family membrane-anchored ribosome-binding protein
MRDHKMSTITSNGKAVDLPASAPNSPDQVTAKFEKYVDQVASSAHRNIDKISGVTHPAVDRVTSTAHSAVDSLSDTAAQTADTLSKKAAQLKEVHARSVESARSHVRDSPLLAVGAAAAVGYLLARILSGR